VNIPQFWNEGWAAAGNHLWQSTLFTVVAGLLVLLLRSSQARTRYWLWLGASLKFLIPFSLLVAFGNHLAPPRSPSGMPSSYYFATEVSQPLTPSTAPVVAPAASEAHQFGLARILPALAAVIWLNGLITVLALWRLRWRRVHSCLRKAIRLEQGREVESLRRIERISAMRRPIPLLLSPETLEPGVFGIFRPVLLWPEGISSHLSDAHLDAILAHEIGHLRHRDNLAAAMHLIIEAIFWFHPLIWWLGAQLVRERERGCDEEVVEMGNQPGVYAEGILKACEFCVASPLAAFSGVTGADLKKRIVRIMTGWPGNKLSPQGQFLLASLGAAAFAGPFVFALVNVPHVRAQLLVAPSGPPAILRGCLRETESTR
jgi:bla regulator protein blaR1